MFMDILRPLWYQQHLHLVPQLWLCVMQAESLTILVIVVNIQWDHSYIQIHIMNNEKW